MPDKRWVVTEVTFVDAPTAGDAIDRVVTDSKEGDQEVELQRATAFSHYVDPDPSAMLEVVENLNAAFRHLEQARGALGTEVDANLDNVSHFLQETYTALGLPQPELE